MAAIIRGFRADKIKLVRRLAKATYLSDASLAKATSVSHLLDSMLAKASYLSHLRLARATSVRYLSDSRLAKAASASNLSDSRLAIGFRLAKASLVSSLLVSALTTAAIWMAIEKGFDVQSGLEKFHLPRPDRPYFNNPIEDHESDNAASFGDKKNRTAELAASKGGPFALAILINKSLFALRLPFAAALICPVAELLAGWSTIINMKALTHVTLLSITVRVEPLLVALWMLWITGSFEYGKKPDNGGGAKQLVVQDLKEESASDGGAISLEMAPQTKAMVVVTLKLYKGGIFEDLANEPKNAMNNLKLDPKGAGKMLYRPFKLHALDEIYERLGIGYIDMVKKLLGGRESGPVRMKGCSVAAPSGMPFDPLRESMDASMKKLTAKTTGSLPLKLCKDFVFVTGRTSESVAAPIKVTTTSKKDI